MPGLAASPARTEIGTCISAKAQFLPFPSRGHEAHLAVLLPKNATVAHVYCGAQSGNGAPAECSAAGCNVPVSLLLDDDLYTQGRALTFTVTGTSPTVQSGATFRVWVLWTLSDSRHGR